MTAKGGVNCDGFHCLLVLGRPLVTGAGLAAVHRSNEFGIPLELRNSEVFEQVSSNKCCPQFADSREFIATKGSFEFGGSLDEEIDAIGRWDRPVTLGLDRDELAYLGSEVLRVIRPLLGGMCNAVLARTRGRRS